MTGTTDAAPPSPPSQPSPRSRPKARRRPTATARSVLVLLREGVWIRLLVAVALLSVAFVFLGRWQYHRHTAKVARNAVIDANYDNAPRPLGDVLATTTTPLPADRQWAQVLVTGVYEPGGTVLVRNRPKGDDIGYEVVVPLRTPSGAAFLIDRGWLPPGDSFGRPDAVPAPPGGTVTVTARLRPGERQTKGSTVADLTRMDVDRMATVAGGEVYRGAYGVVAAEQPPAGTAPTALPRPDEGLGPHLAYSVQWWIGAAAAWVLLGYYAVREVDGRTGTGTARAPSPAAEARRRRRQERRGPTDEEIEDAAGG
jgi:cytochrome oxidase assembly protein ShyY1